MSSDYASDDPDLLTGVKAIAAFLGMREKQARWRIRRGIIPTFALPGANTIHARRSTLMAWLAKCEATSKRGNP